MASFIVDDYMMTNGLHLTGCELLIFALIFSFSRNNQAMYASEGNLAERLGYSRKQVNRALSSLRDSELIIRSGTKHTGLQSYDYQINLDMVRQKVPEWWDKMSQQGETKCPSEERHNVPARRDNMSHNNRNDKNNDNREDKRPHTPFHYFILNNKWNDLCRQPKWQNKSKESLKIALRKLTNVNPVVSYYMMDYSIERSYDKIFEPNNDITKRAAANVSKFFKAETLNRIDLVDTMMSKLNAIIPSDIHIPPKDCFEVTPKGAQIRCAENFHQWIEENGTRTFPIIKEWTLGLNLHYATHK